MIDYLICDVETTTFQKGNPYSTCNKLCLVGILGEHFAPFTFDIEYSDHNYALQLYNLQEEINETKVLVVFNGKFDLAWLRRYGIDFSHCRIWDCQLVHFLLSGQQAVFPSLNQVAEHYGLGQKIDTIKEEYWDKGIDTPQIPLTLLTDYLVQDLSLTEQIYLKQLEEVKSVPQSLQRLISLSNQDLLVLLEMEYNGIKLDFPAMSTASTIINQQIDIIKGELNDIFNAIPNHLINYNSGDCLSALLFGGKIVETVRTTIGVYKTGDKCGLPRYRVSFVEHLLPRRYEPPRGSELKKEGFYATNEETLRSIQGSKEDRLLLDKLLTLSKLEKLNSTYYEGFIKLHQEKDWEEGFIHGQFNQVVARTGRLSSSNPNLQNLPSEMDAMAITRY